MAENFANIRGNANRFYPSSVLYRTQPPSYFEDIENNHENVMKPSLKDSNGDKRSPINGRIMGLFFSVNVDFRTGTPYPQSPYGSKRLNIIAHKLLTENTRLYFADFYCRSRSAHYVTLVVTERNSTADKFCSRNLYELDKRQNLFVRIDRSSVQVTGSGVWVELLYTEVVDIETLINNNAAYFSYVTCTSRTGALSKPQSCSYCNLADADFDRSFVNLYISKSETRPTMPDTRLLDSSGQTGSALIISHQFNSKEAQLTPVNNISFSDTIDRSSLIIDRVFSTSKETIKLPANSISSNRRIDQTSLTNDASGSSKEAVLVLAAVNSTSSQAASNKSKLSVNVGSHQLPRTSTNEKPKRTMKCCSIM